jgi:hypothetical protein
MPNLVLSRQMREVAAQERERIFGAVVKMVGRLTEEVAEMMVEETAAEVRPVEARVVEAKPAKPLNGEAHVLEEMIQKAVDRAISDKFADVLQDISYRIGVLSDVAKSAQGLPHNITSQHLNLAHHLLDGYTFTTNSPSTGYVAWTDCHIVYQGVDYTISNSNTNQRYIYWVQATPSAFQVSNTKPSLGVNDCLVAVNEGGTPHVVLLPGKFRPGATLLDGTVSTNELGSAAVTSAKLAASAVGTSHIADGAVASTKLADGAVVGTKIGAGAVATSKLNLAAHMLYAFGAAVVGLTALLCGSGM